MLERFVFERVEEVYDRLVDETENPATLRNERKNHLLKHLLELCEFLKGKEDENPLNEWFDDEQSNTISSNDVFAKLLQTK